MIVKSKAPFRIGLAGGGTDVNPYTAKFGGEVVNAAIGLYARCAITMHEGGNIFLDVLGRNEEELDLQKELTFQGNSADLVKAVYNRFVKDHGMAWSGLDIMVQSDVPLGSGLGTSSTVVVCLCGAFLELYDMNWTPAEIAEYAFLIEREDLGWAGGKQDQYAAVLGGFNHLVFGTDGRVKREPLLLKDEFISVLEQSIILLYTRQQRHSSDIIKEQQEHVVLGDKDHVNAMHEVKILAGSMRKALLDMDVGQVAHILDRGFMYKKQMADGITNPVLENLYRTGIEAGATAGKISGAGGGGFMIFFVAPSKREIVKLALHTFGGREFPFHFTDKGITTWRE
jgi:D-glycero-alpha-D-manno-heptose-7-phosphate kinase